RHMARAPDLRSAAENWANPGKRLAAHVQPRHRNDLRRVAAETGRRGQDPRQVERALVCDRRRRAHREGRARRLRIENSFPSPFCSMIKLGILPSGRGSNFLAIADSVAEGRLKAEIAVVISNRPDAPGIEAAHRRGLNAIVLPSRGLDREIYDRQLIAALLP